MILALPRLTIMIGVALSASPARADDMPPPCRLREVNVERANHALKSNDGLCVEGSAAAVRLEVRQQTIAAVLSALSTVYKISYRSSSTLDEARDGKYGGSLEHVISRLLDGYDYVIKHEDSHLDVLVFAKKGGQAVVAPALAEINRTVERQPERVSQHH